MPSRWRELFGLDIGRQWPLAPVVGDTPRLAAELVEEGADLVGIDGHALQIGNWARRGLAGAEQAHDRADLVLLGPLEAGVQARLVKAPVPIL